MKTDVPVFGSRRLGTSCTGVVHVNFVTIEMLGAGVLGMRGKMPTLWMSDQLPDLRFMRPSA